jgi:c-di-GMP-binding flagellar brake protein YcgR
MHEKRKFIRFRAPLELKYCDPPVSEGIPVVTKDISMGGVRVTMDSPFEVLPDRLISLQFCLDEQVLDVSGKVAWAKDYGDKVEVGVCFVSIPDYCKEQIYNYLFSHYRQEFTRKWWQM